MKSADQADAGRSRGRAVRHPKVVEDGRRCRRGERDSDDTRGDLPRGAPLPGPPGQDAPHREFVSLNPAMNILDQLKRTPLYSEELGIDLAARDDDQYFRWLLASLLFGGHISETIARHTYQVFCRHELTTPHRILDAGWDFLVNPIMREGGYVRYDLSKSDQILRDCKDLVDAYQGSPWRVHETARDKSDLEARLLAFDGVGPVTVNIFLRELRPFWPKADPSPLPMVLTLAASCGIDLARYRRKTLTFVRIEAGLIRMRREQRRRPAPAMPASEIAD